VARDNEGKVVGIELECDGLAVARLKVHFIEAFERLYRRSNRSDNIRDEKLDGLLALALARIGDFDGS